MSGKDKDPLKISIEKISKEFFYKKDSADFVSSLSNIKDEMKRLDELSKYEIEQGDILVKFPKNFLESALNPFALIVGTYSCDIQKTETVRIHFLPIFTLKSLNIKLFKSFVQSKAKTNTKKKIDLNNLNKIRDEFKKLNAPEQKKFKEFVKNIFQFKNRNFFLICPHKLLDNKWCYVDIQSILTVKKDMNLLTNIIKYTKLSIRSPWKEKFGSILSSRYGKVAVDHFTDKEILYIYNNLQ